MCRLNPGRVNSFLKSWTYFVWNKMPLGTNVLKEVINQFCVEAKNPTAFSVEMIFSSVNKFLLRPILLLPA